MQEPEIYAKLTPIFHDIFDDESIVLNPQLTAEDVDGWDSFKHVALMVQIERTFGVKFRTAEMESMRNLAGMVQGISNKLVHRA